MKLGDQIAKVREMTHDTAQGDYRASDLQVLRFLCDGISRLWSVRPASRYAFSTGALAYPVSFPTTAEALAALELDTDPRWDYGVVCYAAARCFELDVTDSVKLQLRNDYFQRADAEFMS